MKHHDAGTRSAVVFAVLLGAGAVAQGAEADPAAPAAVLAGEGYAIRLLADGGTEITIAAGRYRLDSWFSYPGAAIGYVVLGESPVPQAAVPPVIRATDTGEVQVRAESPAWVLERRVAVTGPRIELADRVTCRAPEDIGVLVRHRLRAPVGASVLLGGAPDSPVTSCPTNPTVYLSTGGSSLGLVAEGTLARVQFEAAADAEGAIVSANHLAVRPGQAIELRWALYPLAVAGDYFAFINRVRRDWGSNHRIEGPFDFGPPEQVLRDPARLAAYLKRKALRIAAPGHWLDYDNYDAGKGRYETRAEYRERMRSAAAALHAVDPALRVVGNMEGPLVSLPVDLSRALWEALPEGERGQHYPKPFTARQLELLRVSAVPQRDSLLVGPDGGTFYELYYRGPKEHRTPLVAALVYPAPGNGQMAFWLDQARFLMEEVGLDGIYLDGGGPVSGARYGYDRWDGVTVDIDPATGRITRRCTDYLALIGGVPCQTLFDYVLGRGGVVVANGHHYTDELQRYPIPRLLETGGAYDPMKLAVGEKPPFIASLPRLGHLDAPVALSLHPPNHGEEAVRDYARFVMKCVITHLRHGLLYYYYNIEIPDTGPGSGEYGPINRMYPITPVELREGTVIGKERIVTARSLDLVWPAPAAPVGHVYDLYGREVLDTTRCRMTPAEGGWRIEVKLTDWAEIAVVEQAPIPAAGP